MLRPLHFDRAFAQTSEVTDTIPIDIVTLDLARPRNALKPGRGIESAVFTTALAQRPGSGIARVVIVLRSGLGIRAVRLNHMSGSVCVLPQNDKAIVVDTAATA